jgi:hypothetical protein
VVGTHLGQNLEILIFFGFLNFFSARMEKKNGKKKWKKNKNAEYCLYRSIPGLDLYNE